MLFRSKITTGTKDICTDADLVVDAALEVMEVKQQTFKELQDIVPATCMFATNTSSSSYLRVLSICYLCWGIIEVYLSVLRSIGRVGTIA